MSEPHTQVPQRPPPSPPKTNTPINIPNDQGIEISVSQPLVENLSHMEMDMEDNMGEIEDIESLVKIQSYMRMVRDMRVKNERGMSGNI